MSELLSAQAQNQKLGMENAKLLEKLRRAESTPKTADIELQRLRDSNRSMEAELQRYREVNVENSQLKQEVSALQQRIKVHLSELAASRAESEELRLAVDALHRERVALLPRSPPVDEVHRLRESMSQLKHEQAAALQQLRDENDALRAAHQRDLAAARARHSAATAAQAEQHERTVRRIESQPPAQQRDRDRELDALWQRCAADIAASAIGTRLP